MSNPDLESRKGGLTSKSSQEDDMATTIQEVQQESTIEKKSEAPSAPPPNFPDGGLQAWSVVIGVFFLMFSTFGVAVSWGAFQAYYEQSMLRNYSSSTIAWIGSLQFSLMFMPGSITGRLLDMGYHKLPLGLASAVLIVCAFLVAECTQYWHFVLCQGLGMGIAAGFIFPPTLGLVSQWFHRRRATAFGVTASGTALGGILFPIMIRFLLPSVGFKWTARIIAFVMTFALSIGFLLTRTRLPPRPVVRFFTLEIYKSSKLLFYCASSFFAFLGLYAILTFLPVSAEAKGIDSNLAFYLVSIMNGASIVGRVTAGMVGDKVGPLNCMIPMTLVAAGATFAWPYAHNVAGFVLVAIVYGLAFGAFVGLLPSPAASLGPLHTVGERIGVQLTIMSIAILVGSPIAGAIEAHPLGFKGAGAYAGSFIVLSVIFMVFTKRAATGQWIGGKI